MTEIFFVVAVILVSVGILYGFAKSSERMRADLEARVKSDEEIRYSCSVMTTGPLRVGRHGQVVITNRRLLFGAWNIPLLSKTMKEFDLTDVDEFSRRTFGGVYVHVTTQTEVLGFLELRFGHSFRENPNGDVLDATRKGTSPA